MGQTKKIKYKCVDGIVREIEVSLAVAAVLTRSKNKEKWQRRSNKRFCDGMGYREGESELAMRKQHLVNPVTEAVQESLLQEKIQLAITNLTSVQQRRFVAHMQGYTYAEIAHSESVSEKAIRRSVALAKRKLKVLISEGSDLPFTTP